MNTSSNKLLAGFAFAMLLLISALPARAGFLGHTVHAEYLFPDTSSVAIDFGDAVVGGGAEFSVFLDSEITVDISDADIGITIFWADSFFNPEPFSGFHFYDVLATIDPISNVTISATNNFAFDSSRLAFDADNIFLNFEGLDVVTDSSLSLAVSFTQGKSEPGPNPVPEPLSGALVGLGLGALGLARRKG